VSNSSLDSLLAEIGSLAYTDLKVRYEEVIDRPPPPRLSQDLLRRALAYQIQASRIGGLSHKVEKLLRAASTPKADKENQRLIAGTQLIREWQGQMHVVDILENGYRWRDERFASLSAVARKITGTRWSGPRFFGLTGSGKT